VSTFPPELFKVSYKGTDPFGDGSRLDHRRYVGADAGSGLEFAEAAKFQLDFLLRQGLRKDDVLLDLGCGCLRGGIHLIRYLAAEKYLGMDISAEVVRRGILMELGLETFTAKRPEFVISDCYEIGLFSKTPSIVFANSLFTHVDPSEIRLCLSRLPQSVTFYTTFTESQGTSFHDGPGHYLGGTSPMTYTREEMHALGREQGFSSEYVGAWGHPKNAWNGRFRQQMMFKFQRGLP
jgi:hypothetical protein